MNGSYTQFKPWQTGGSGQLTDPLQGGGMRTGMSSGQQQPIYPGQWQGGGGGGQVGGYPGQWQGGQQYGQHGNGAWGGGQQAHGGGQIAGLMQQMYSPSGQGGGSQGYGGWGGLQTNQGWR